MLAFQENSVEFTAKQKIDFKLSDMTVAVKNRNNEFYKPPRSISAGVFCHNLVILNIGTKK